MYEKSIVFEFVIQAFVHMERKDPFHRIHKSEVGILTISSTTGLFSLSESVNIMIIIMRRRRKRKRRRRR